MKNRIIYILLLLMSSCVYKEKYYINSPKGDKILTFEWINTLNPNKRGYVKIYPENSNKNFIAIRPIMDFPINIYWGDTMKVRCGILISADTSAGLINWKSDYTKLEQTQMMNDTVIWKHYFLNKIPEGYYK